MSSGGTRPGLQNPTPTSRARPVLYLRTAATFALAALRRAGRTSRLAHQLSGTLAMFAAMRRASRLSLLPSGLLATDLDRIADLWVRQRGSGNLHLDD